MPAQGSLEGFEAPEAPIDNLFFALLPDAATADRVEKLSSAWRRQAGIKVRPRATWHVTLFHVGNFAGVPESTVALARSAADTLCARPFEITLARQANFGGAAGNRAGVLLPGESPALTAFQAALRQCMLKAGFTQGRSAAKFSPHLTLAYGPALPAQAIDPIVWEVREFALVHSIQGQTRHVVLGRWPLGVTDGH